MFHVGYVLERVHIDIMGPLMETKKGIKHILAIADQFTRWLEAFPLKNKILRVKEMCELLEIGKTRTTSYRPSANGEVERYNNRSIAQITRSGYVSTGLWFTVVVPPLDQKH